MEKAEKPKSESGTALAAGEPKKPAHEAKATAHGKRYGEAFKRLVVDQIEGGKIVGDALHVFFGAPLEIPDHAERAVDCALDTLMNFAKLCPQLPGR